MLQTARRRAEIESVVKMVRYVVHIDNLEANALAKSRGSADVRPFECGNPVGVLPCLLPTGTGRIVRRLICSDNGASERGEKGWQWLTSNPKAQTCSPLVKKLAFVEGLTEKEKLPMLPMQCWN